MKKLFNIYVFILLGALIFSSCVDDLDQTPIDPDVLTEDKVYESIDGYYSVLSKVYAGLAITGQVGPAGDGDVGGIDEGFSSYIRGLWNIQVLPTDEAICAWGDFGISELNYISFSAANPFSEGFYYRVYQQIAMANEFLRQSTDGQLEGRGQSDLIGEMAQLRAEARFLRAYSYWHGIDIYGDIPFVSDEDPIGLFLPDQMSREDIYAWLITELDAIEADLSEAGTAEYGRVDKGAAWMLKAKLYENAEVYTGTAAYTDMISELDKVIAAYTFYTGDYGDMFLSDNNKLENATATSGFIFYVPQDGQQMQSYGASNFVILGATGGSMSTGAMGISGGWGGNRVLPNYVDRFDAIDTRGIAEDRVIKRYYLSDDLVDFDEARDSTVSGNDGLLFNSTSYTEMQYVIDTVDAALGTVDLRYVADVEVTEGSKTIDDVSIFNNGYGFMKFRNTRSDGAEPAVKDFVSTDFPLFRLADAYLMYAEGFIRGASGATGANAVAYVNAIRQRAFGDESGDITLSDLTDDFILDERSRELSWECSRRTDLIRYDRFTSSSYLWSWKGGVADGRGVSTNYNLFAIPSKDINANPNLVQNPGY